jgi:hypothetical protein
MRESGEPDHWTGSKGRRTLCRAEVVVDVSGVTAALSCRPFQMPASVNGLRVHVETTRRWANEVEYAALEGMHSDIRLSAVAEGESWGQNPSFFRFGTTEDEIRPALRNAGIYTVTFAGKGPDDEPVTVKTRVVVEEGPA